MPTTSGRQASANLAAALAAGQAAAIRALGPIGTRIVTDVRVSLSSPAAPSAPGTPPAHRTGGLQASYRAVTGRDTRGRHYVAILSHHRAAAYNEFGTSRQPPRPALRPAVHRAEPAITPQIAEAWNAAVREATRGS